ncbi:MAG: hypothetical protein HQL34_04060 [Alphaproteobacteria bacterium]|nr:hypothetical protein [Alphaproteobacteria bacterium]
MSKTNMIDILSEAIRTRAANNGGAVREGSPDLIALETFRREPVLVAPDDPIFAAALLAVVGRNILLAGPAGTGKTVRLAALLHPENYSLLLAEKRLATVRIEIRYVHVNLIPIVAASELAYEHRQDEDGLWSKELAGLDAFIRDHGFLDRAEFLAVEEKRCQVLAEGRGTITLHVAWIDDFDRVQDSHLLNAFLRQIEDHHHVLANGETRWLNLSCFGSSNSGVGRPTSGYLGSMGLDTAVANRFVILHVPARDSSDVLKAEFPGSHAFIDKLCAATAALEEERNQGGLAGMGELGLRRLRPCVELHTWGGLSEAEAAAVLTAGLTDEQERANAGMLIGRFFGKREAGWRDINF